MLARLTWLARIARLTGITGLARTARITLITAAATGGVLRAAGVGSRVQHGDVAAAHGTEDVATGERIGSGRDRGGRGRSRLFAARGRSGGGAFGFVWEGGRFPALGRVLELGGREDVEFGLFLGLGERGRFDGGRDGRDLRGSGGFHGLGNERNRSRGNDHGGRGGCCDGGRFCNRSFVRRGERVLVFARRSHDLDGGGLVGCGVAGGGRRGGRRTDAFAAREARTAIGAEGGTEVGGGRGRRAGGLGGGPRGRATGRGCI